MKSPLYVAIHHVLNNISSEKRIIDLIILGEDEEVISYFPEYADTFHSMRERIDRLIAYNEREFETIGNVEYSTQKELAEYVNTTICPHCLFCVIKGKPKSVKDFVYSMSTDKIITYLNKLQP